MLTQSLYCPSPRPGQAAASPGRRPAPPRPRRWAGDATSVTAPPWAKRHHDVHMPVLNDKTPTGMQDARTGQAVAAHARRRRTWWSPPDSESGCESDVLACGGPLDLLRVTGRPRAGPLAGRIHADHGPGSVGPFVAVACQCLPADHWGPGACMQLALQGFQLRVRPRAAPAARRRAVADLRVRGQLPRVTGSKRTPSRRMATVRYRRMHAGSVLTRRFRPSRRCGRALEF
jgi:hypothetical protein